MPPSSSDIDFQELVQLAGDAIVVRDPAGRVRFWNRGAERLYGFTATEALGRVLHELLRTRFPEPLEAIERQLAEDGCWEGMLRHTAADGRPLVVQSRQIRRGGPAGGVIAIDRDDTSRDAAEAARARMERQFHLSTSHLPMMVATIDRDRCFTYANRAYTERFELTPADVIGRPMRPLRRAA